MYIVPTTIFFIILVTLFYRALIRPGRLEEHIGLSLPDCAQRRACLLSLFDSETQALLAGADGSSGGEQTVVEQRIKEIDDIARCTEQKYALFCLLQNECDCDSGVLSTLIFLLF